MPFLRIYTNAAVLDGNVEQFVERASELLSEQLGKPKKYVVVSFNHDQMSFGGSADNKGVLAYFDSIGFSSDKQNLIKLIAEFLHDRLGIDLANINIVTNDLSANDVAIGGKVLG